MDHLGSLLERPRLYCNIDGLLELGAGVMCLGFAFVWWLLMRSPVASAWHQISFFVFVGLMLLIHYGTKAVKMRITFPRTGFVEYRRQWQTSGIAAVVGAVTAVALSFAFRWRWDVSMLVPLVGLVFAVRYGYVLARATRWKWVIAGAMVVASLVIAFLPADVLSALGSEVPAHPHRARLLGMILLSLIVYGTLLLISGGISFRFYLRRTRVPAQEGR